MISIGENGYPMKLYDCDGCERTGLQAVAGAYEIKKCKVWDGMMICQLCRDNGIVEPKPKLRSFLEKSKIKVQHNEDGSIIVPH